MNRFSTTGIRLDAVRNIDKNTDEGRSDLEKMARNPEQFTEVRQAAIEKLYPEKSRSVLEEVAKDRSLRASLRGSAIRKLSTQSVEFLRQMTGDQGDPVGSNYARTRLVKLDKKLKAAKRSE